MKTLNTEICVRYIPLVLCIVHCALYTDKYRTDYCNHTQTPDDDHVKGWNMEWLYREFTDLTGT